MQKLKKFLIKYIGFAYALVGGLIITLAESASTYSLLIWHCEPTMPKCLIED